MLLHKMPNGEEMLVAFTSRTLSSAKCNYSKVEKRDTGMRLCGQEVSLIYFQLIIYVGQRPQAIAHPQASARVQRWALTLAMYSYQIAFKPTTAHSNANGLSRLPLPEAPSEVPVPPKLVLLVEHLLDTPVKAHENRT